MLRAIGLAVGWMAAMSGSLLAHHGWGTYDTSRSLTVTGPIRSLKFENPHVTMTVKDADKVWTLVLSAPSRLLNRGVTAEHIGVGRPISADGYASTVLKDTLRATRIIIDGKSIEMR